MKDYLQLTQQGKARRLRQLALKSLQQYDLNVSKLSLITNEQNGIFRVDTRDREKYVLRVALPDGGHSASQINSEMIFLNALAQSPYITALQPIVTKSGEWFTTVSVDGVPQARYCAIFTWISGVDLADRRSPETWEKFGQLSAQLHRFASTFTPPDNFSIYTFDSIFPFKEECALFDEGNRQFFTAEEFDLLEMAVDRVQSEIDELHSDTSAIHVTHGDLHHWNVRIARGKLSPIDFEDMMWAHPIQDIGITLYYNRYAENYDDLLASFKAGYGATLPFPERYEGQVETHMLARRFGLLNYVFTAGEEDIREFPNFISLTMERIRYVREHVWT